MLESKQGNSYSIGVLYLALCEILDVPIFAVDIPRQFIFAFIDTIHNFLAPDDHGIQHIQFYIDPISGMIYSQNDVDAYLKKINAKGEYSGFAPMLTRRIIYKMLEELALCYRYRREDSKADEIQQLMKLLRE